MSVKFPLLREIISANTYAYILWKYVILMCATLEYLFIYLFKIIEVYTLNKSLCL